jgi:glycolate oxidase FAD binding subunit
MLRSIPFHSALRDALGDNVKVLPNDCARFAVSGVVPKAVASPRSLTKLSLVVAAAAAEGGIIVIRGAGTKMRRPPPPAAVDVVLDLHQWKGVVSHAASDLVATVRSGTTLAALDAELEKNGQFWPCDAPFAQTATVGGTIASNANGALRLRYGAIRDLVLGARYVDAAGGAISAGAKVVKSVAGYDIQKLLVGSFGTLGVIADATLKLAARPPDERTLVARFARAPDAVRAANEIARSGVFPMAIALHDAASTRRIGAIASIGGRDGWTLLIRCGGNRRSTALSIDRVAAACAERSGQPAGDLDRAGTARAWADIRELAGGASYSSDAFAALKIVTLPSECGAALDSIGERWPLAERTAHPPSGIAFANLPIDRESASAPSTAEALRGFDARGWQSMWLRAPLDVCARMPMPAARIDAAALMRRVKAAFDPAGLFDPGRLPGGV